MNTDQLVKDLKKVINDPYFSLTEEYADRLCVNLNTVQALYKFKTKELQVIIDEADENYDQEKAEHQAKKIKS